MQLKGRGALVTGGARRIGRQVALALARRGAHVAISYRTSSRDAQQTVRALDALGVRAAAIRADLSSVRQARQLVAETARRFGRLDVLVNSASLFMRTPLDRLTERAWDAHLDANLKGPAFCALEAGRVMRRQGVGTIINIADWAAERPYRDYLPYCVSKAGVIALTRGLAKELAPRVRVIAISPGPILPPPDMTPAQRRRAVARLPLKRWGSPDDIATAVVFAVEGGDFMTGSTITVDGGRSVA